MAVALFSGLGDVAAFVGRADAHLSESARRWSCLAVLTRVSAAADLSWRTVPRSSGSELALVPGAIG